MTNQTSEILKACGFQHNPFVIVPPSDWSRVIWAGDPKRFNQLKNAVYSPSQNNLINSEMMVLIGDFGAGKTNALKNVANHMNEQGDLVGMVRAVAVGDNPSWRDYVHTLFTRTWTRETIVSRLRNFRQYVLKEAGDRAAVELGSAASDLDQLSRITKNKIEDICREEEEMNPGFVKFVLDLADSNNPDRSQTAWSYLTQKKLSPTDGRKFNEMYDMSPEGLSSDYTATNVLAGLIRIMTKDRGSGPGSQVVGIFIDEVEDWYEFTNSSRQSVLKGLRDLHAETTEHMALLLAGTLSDAAELYGLLGEPLLARLSRPTMMIEKMEADEARVFLLDIMGQSRSHDFSRESNWPFTNEGLHAFVNYLVEAGAISARTIIRNAGQITLRTYSEKIMAGDPIDENDINEAEDWLL